MATKRFDNLNKDGRLRKDLEIWSADSNIDIIRWPTLDFYDELWYISNNETEIIWAIF